MLPAMLSPSARARRPVNLKRWYSPNRQRSGMPSAMSTTSATSKSTMHCAPGTLAARRASQSTTALPRRWSVRPLDQSGKTSAQRGSSSRLPRLRGDAVARVLWPAQMRVVDDGDKAGVAAAVRHVRAMALCVRGQEEGVGAPDQLAVGDVTQPAGARRARLPFPAAVRGRGLAGIDNGPGLNVLRAVCVDLIRPQEQPWSAVHRVAVDAHPAPGPRLNHNQADGALGTGPEQGRGQRRYAGDLEGTRVRSTQEPGVSCQHVGLWGSHRAC